MKCLCFVSVRLSNFLNLSTLWHCKLTIFLLMAILIQCLSIFKKMCQFWPGDIKKTIEQANFFAPKTRNKKLWLKKNLAKKCDGICLTNYQTQRGQHNTSWPWISWQIFAVNERKNRKWIINVAETFAKGTQTPLDRKKTYQQQKDT